MERGAENREARELASPTAGRAARLSRHVILAATVLAVFTGGAPGSAAARGASAEVRETHRIRIVNQAGGAVGVSLDRGRRYEEVARVTRPAAASMPGFSAIAGVAPGAIAALTLDRWLIRVDVADTPSTAPRVTGLCARGSSAGEAFAEIDLPPAALLFTSLAPLLGSRVFLQVGGALQPMRRGYTPRPGDVWVIVVEPPTRLPAELILENRLDGAVTAVDRNGSAIVVGRVVKPVRGVGRYPGTEIASPGRLAAHHPGAFQVATPGVTDGVPGASGMVIQSLAFTDAAAREAPSVLLVEPRTGREPSLFTLPIPFRGAGGETRVEMQWAGKPWEALPLRSSADPTVFVAEDGTLVERFRVRVGALLGEELAAALRRMARPAAAGAATRERPAGRPAASAKGPVYRGRLTIAANITGRGIQIVKFLLDGQLRAIDNVEPYEWEWDTRTSANGEHVIEIQGLDLTGKLINSTSTRVVVAN